MVVVIVIFRFLNCVLVVGFCVGIRFIKMNVNELIVCFSDISDSWIGLKKGIKVSSLCLLMIMFSNVWWILMNIVRDFIMSFVLLLLRGDSLVFVLELFDNVMFVLEILLMMLVNFCVILGFWRGVLIKLIFWVLIWRLLDKVVIFLNVFWMFFVKDGFVDILVVSW